MRRQGGGGDNATSHDLIVGVDVLFLRHQFWPRLFVNIGIVVVFAAGYFQFLKRR